MKDYAKTINQSKEIHGQQQGRQTLTKSAVQTAKTLEHEKKSTEGSRGFFSIVAVFIVVAVLFAAYRQYVRHRAETNPQPKPAAAETAPAQPTGPQFDFYTVLPNGTTTGAQSAAGATAATASGTSSAGNASTATTTPATTNATAGNSAASPSAPTTTMTTTTPASGAAPIVQITPAAPPQYYLDAGSFANSADAQQMLSQLLLLGVQANIKTTQDNGSPAYEVLVGPFDDQDTMGIVKNQLSAHQIQATVVQSGSTD